MSQETLVFSIKGNGDVKVEVKGVESKQCLDITKSIEDSLGTVLNREFKPEYYQSVKDVTLQHNKNQS